ncbi:MAG: hypothetical protein PHD60_11185 [Clostridia bacterium]|nr:hypothetical protein [Clostridia bacterium]
MLRIVYDKYGYSARTFDKFLKIARTFADIDGSSKIKKKILQVYCYQEI